MKKVCASHICDSKEMAQQGLIDFLEITPCGLLIGFTAPASSVQFVIGVTEECLLVKLLEILCP